MTRDDYIAEQERICTAFAFEEITHDEAMDALCRLGFDEKEALDLLIEAIA